MSQPVPEPDPALVAASGPAAAAVLGTEPAPGQAPTSGIPPVPASPPVPPSSRYHGVGVAVWVSADGSERPFLRRRLIAQPEALALAGWETVAPGDRIDLIAGRALGDPTAFWQLCDANLVFDPTELEVTGRGLRVTLPEGFPGGSGG